MSVVLIAEGLTKRYGPGCDVCLDRTGPDAGTNICPQCGTIVALGGVGLTLHRGEILAIMGESGSGKSTLLRLLDLRERPDSGQLWYQDESEPSDMLAMNRSQARQLRDSAFGFVHQNPRLGLNFQLTAGGNIAERLLARGDRRYESIRGRARDLLARTEVPASRMDQSPSGFSGGMQQRVQIAKALAARPKLLLLDELTSGLDLSVQARILDLVLELHQELRIAILVVTHDIGVAKLLATQTLVMRNGRVVESGLTDQILEDPQHPYTQELVSAAL